MTNFVGSSFPVSSSRKRAITHSIISTTTVMVRFSPHHARNAHAFALIIFCFGLLNPWLDIYHHFTIFVLLSCFLYYYLVIPFYLIVPPTWTQCNYSEQNIMSGRCCIEYVSGTVTSRDDLIGLGNHMPLGIWLYHVFRFSITYLEIDKIQELRRRWWHWESMRLASSRSCWCSCADDYYPTTTVLLIYSKCSILVLETDS